MPIIDSYKDKIAKLYISKYYNYIKSPEKIITAVKQRHENIAGMSNISIDDILNFLENDGTILKFAEKDRLQHFFGDSKKPDDRDHKLCLKDRFILDALKFRIEFEIQEELFNPLLSRASNASLDAQEQALKRELMTLPTHIDPGFLRDKSQIYGALLQYATNVLIPATGNDMLWNNISPDSDTVFQNKDGNLIISKAFLLDDILVKQEQVKQEQADNVARTRLMGGYYGILGFVAGFAIALILVVTGIIILPVFEFALAPVIIPLVFAAIVGSVLGVASSGFGVIISKIFEKSPQIPLVSSGLTVLGGAPGASGDSNQENRKGADPGDQLKKEQVPGKTVTTAPEAVAEAAPKPEGTLSSTP